MDPSRLPEEIRDRLAVIGYWVCPPGLRGQVARWDDLDEAAIAEADRSLRLMESVVTR